MALDRASIPTRSIVLGEEKVDLSEVERRGIKQKVARLKQDLVRYFGEQSGFVHV